MTDPTELQSMMGQTAIDADGSKIGKIGQIYLDDQTGQPVWLTVHTGLFGNKENFAPVYGSRVVGDDLQLAVSKDIVKDAPGVEADGHLEDDENEALYTYYSGHLGQSEGPAYSETKYTGGERADLVGDAGVVGHDTSGPTTDEAMTRSEERLHVGTERVQAGRARLRKYIVTEQVTQTIPVSHEEVRLEREPITDANRGAAMSGVDISEEEHEVTLYAERPVVAKETVPVERVRLSTETVTENQQVSETLRKEQIDEVPEIVTTGEAIDPDKK